MIRLKEKTHMIPDRKSLMLPKDARLLADCCEMTEEAYCVLKGIANRRLVVISKKKLKELQNAVKENNK